MRGNNRNRCILAAFLHIFVIGGAVCVALNGSKLQQTTDKFKKSIKSLCKCNNSECDCEDDCDCGDDCDCQFQGLEEENLGSERDLFKKEVYAIRQDVDNEMARNNEEGK